MDWATLIIIFSAAFLVGIFTYFIALKLDRKTLHQQPLYQGRSRAARSLYFIFYTLIIWYLLFLILPSFLVFSQEISYELEIWDRVYIAAKLLSAPIVLLIVFYYGKRRGFLSWIKEIDWPNDK